MPSVEVIADWNSFLQLEQEWDQCIDQMDPHAIFLKHMWFRLWGEAFLLPKLSYGTQLFILKIKEGLETVGFVPLYIHRQWTPLGFIKVLSFLTNDHSPKVDFICPLSRRKEIAYSMVLFLRYVKGCSKFEFEDLLDGSDSHQSIKETLSQLGWPIGQKYIRQSPYLKLPENIPEFYEKLSKKLKKDIRRATEKLTLQGKISVDYLMKSDEIQKGWPSIEQISSQSWQYDQGTSVVAESTVTQFYKKLLLWAAVHGKALLVILKINDKPIAFKIDVIEQKIVYGLKKEFVQDYRACSPGTVLEALSLEKMVEWHFCEYDFLGLAEPHKMLWTETTRAYVRDIAYPSTWKGWLLYDLNFPIRQMIKRNVQRLMLKK